MKVKNKIKKTCLMLGVLICSCFIINSAYGYSSEAVRLYNDGIENVKNENYDDAAKNFRKAIFQDKSLTDAYFNLGSVYKEMGQMDKAKEILATLLRKDPFDDEAAFFMAKLYFDTEEYEKALIYLNTITDLSVRYDKACDLASLAKEKIKERELAKIKASRDWDKKVLEGFDGPAGVARDSKGNIYVASYKANVVQKISADTEEKRDFISEKIEGPVGLAVDSQDNLYVAGYISGNIVRISPEGEVKVVLDEIKNPYYLSIKDDVLFVTEQNKNTMIMVNLWKLQE